MTSVSLFHYYTIAHRHGCSLNSFYAFVGYRVSLVYRENKGYEVNRAYGVSVDFKVNPVYRVSKVYEVKMAQLASGVSRVLRG